MAKKTSVDELAERTKTRLLVGIYIRVSSEVQAEKVSPEIQEGDCRKFCEDNGYTVVDMYREVAPYRSGGKMVQPSGTRVDRPQLQRILKDARDGRINCIVAWREDRLYRGLRPMLEVLDTFEALDGRLRIELVKDHFDPNLAPIKAWMARMELQAKNDRWYMGMRGRVAAGKSLGGAKIYGYDYDPDAGVYRENPDETKWIRKVWNWYADGLSYREIREHLITDGVEQVKKARYKSPWSVGLIQHLVFRDYYATGVKANTLGGETVEQEMPAFIDQTTYKRVLKRRAKNADIRAQHRQTHEYGTAWCEGLVHCAGDGWKMHKDYLYDEQRFLPIYEYYRCTCGYHTGKPDPRHVSAMPMSWLDRYVWNALYRFLSDPEEFDARIQQRTQQLQQSAAANTQQRDELVQRVESLKEERRRVTNMYRKKYINDDELAEQMKVIEAEESELQSAIAETQDGFGDEVEHLVELSRTYRERMADGIINLQYEPTDPNKFRTWSKMVKEIIQALVLRVNVDRENNVEILTHIDLSSPIDVSGGGGGGNGRWPHGKKGASASNHGAGDRQMGS